MVRAVAGLGGTVYEVQGILAALTRHLHLGQTIANPISKCITMNNLNKPIKRSKAEDIIQSNII